ncbi:biliverdin-producing heme oxygenase [Chiayiivirga flava]|uniref:Heme oxygenase n=1 Tax=Chiayiivirga flava TaxID=659595 RepID=A0A7W8G242_9GAMM|nr:biliverdin-producing heme oxygenase [Chiayiivirga flava]MBB5209558.1 heme oxygenase [Chiayiivirga flava]
MLPTTARRALRAATRDAHARAEAAPAMAALLTGTLDAHRYRRLLASLHRHFVRWERERGAFLRGAGTAAGWCYASRAALLADDLQIPAPARSALPDPWPRAEPAHAWGELYVIEGSTLGARLLARRLRDILPEAPRAYFSFGSDDPAHWPRFERTLERALADPATHAAAIDGASRAFADITRALERTDA